MFINIPGRKETEIRFAVFDFNGTLAVDGVISDIVKEKLTELSKLMKIYIITSDTYKTAKEQCSDLPATLKILEGPASSQKAEIVKDIGESFCVCFGNGFNDVGMFKCSSLSIAVGQNEGICTQLFAHADIFVNDILDGIDLLLKSDRLIAGLRN